MLHPLDDLPPGVIGFEAVGEVEADDYERVLDPAVDAAANDGRIRLVYVLGDRFTGYSAGAAWQDTRLGLTHLKAWDRLALVSDLDWVEHLVGLFGWMVPGDVKLFGLNELPRAIDWAAGDGGVT
jgi:hypothetical protein